MNGYGCGKCRDFGWNWEDVVMREWKKRLLVDVTSKIGSGATPKGGNEAYKETGISLFRSLNVHDGFFKEKNLAFIDEEQARKLSNVVVQEGDVLLNITGASIARCCVAPSKLLPARVNQHVSIIRPKSDQIDTHFLAYLFISKEYKNALLTTGEKAGSTRQALTKTQLQNFEILLPPLAEQKRIVGILDEAFEGIDRAIANTQKNLANARELFEIYLSKIFLQDNENWSKSKMRDVCAFSQGVQVAVNLQSESIGKDKDTRFLRIVDFTQGNTYPRYIENPGVKYVVDEDDISLVRYGASTGFVCRGLKGVIANNLFRVIPLDEKLTKDYLYYFLCSSAFQNKIKLAIGGAAMPAISFGLIKNIEILFPKVFQQHQIVEKLNDLKLDIDHLEATYEQKLAALNELKQSILQKAFTGELTADSAEPVTQPCRRSPQPKAKPDATDRTVYNATRP